MFNFIKKIIFAAILIFSGFAFSADDLGLGIIIGDPTGLSFKYNMNSANSIDGAIAWSNSVDFHIHGDYLWNKPKVLHLDHYPLDLFYGVGGRLRDRNNNRFKSDDDGDLQLAGRAPIGLRFMFHDPSIEIFTELAILLNLIPSTSADLDFGIGARYFF